MESTSILIYLAKSGVAFSALYVPYLLLFKRGQYPQVARFYLLLTIVFALLFPFISITKYHTVELPASVSFAEAAKVDTPAIASGNATFIQRATERPARITLMLYLTVGLFLLGRMLFMLVRFSVKLFKHSRIETLQGQRVIVSNHWDRTFSFFGIIVLPQRDLAHSQSQLLLQHELAHAKQWHSLDLLLAELFQIIQWFNPLAYYIGKDLREVHEYLADSSVVDSGAERYAYQQLLLGYLSNAIVPRAANPFSAKLLKKRFAMMTTSNKSKRSLLKYALALPIVASLIGLMSFQTKTIYTFGGLPEGTKIPEAEQSESPVAIQQTTKLQPTPLDDFKKMRERLNQHAAGLTEMAVYEIKDAKKPLDIKVSLKSGMEYKFFLITPNDDKFIGALFLIADDAKGKSGKEMIFPNSIFYGNGFCSSGFESKKTGTFEITFPPESLTTKKQRKIEECLIGIYEVGSFNMDPNDQCHNLIIRSVVDSTGSIDQASTAADITLHTKNEEALEDVFVAVEKMPTFGDSNEKDAAEKYIAQKLKYPEQARKEKIEGQVFVSFIVEKDGSVSTATIARGLYPALDTEAIRVVGSMPKWTPGYQRGQAVRVKMTLPVIFVL